MKEEFVNLLLDIWKKYKVYLIIGGILIGILVANLTPSQQPEAKSIVRPISQITSTSSHADKITVDISGAVKHEGVYTLDSDARLTDLLEACGGLKSNAQIKVINRAQLLHDQDKIYIPKNGEKVACASTNSSQTDGSSDDNNQDKVNLNKADVKDLQKLTGIGEKRAEQIIAFREQNVGFKTIEDLMKVSGIGEKTFATLKDQLTI
ncbi:MAG: helix-hairpin-helix domain-containing protein [Lactobacillus sp.]|nr:helix-hairpin-helix domain-containing protein [Lactobacillus sp.]